MFAGASPDRVPIGPCRHRRFSRALCRSRRQARRRRLRRAAAVAGRDGGGRRRRGRAADASRHDAARRDLARDQARRRPHGADGRIEEAGAVVAAGICFYQSYAREMAEANGWKRLMTNSAKLVNIMGGYGYRPTLASLERCVDSAVAGRVALDADRAALPPGDRPGGERHRARRRRQFQRALRSRPQPRASSRARATSSPGESYVDRILVLDSAKGGVATAWMLRDMEARGIVPLALIFNRVNPILAQGAAFGGVALVDRFAERRNPALPHRRRAARRPRRGHRRDSEPRGVIQSLGGREHFQPSRDRYRQCGKHHGLPLIFFGPASASVMVPIKSARRLW